MEQNIACRFVSNNLKATFSKKIYYTYIIHKILYELVNLRGIANMLLHTTCKWFANKFLKKEVF